MTTKQTRIAALAAVLALPIGLAGISIASAQNPAHAAAAQPATAARAVAEREVEDNDVEANGAETNDDGAQAHPGAKAVPAAATPAGDGDGESNDDGPAGSNSSSR
ncbi:MAG: hypothetical protein M3169_12760 [Candidatus Eremiobacteraeota bacterium]|nr:hypothetical protein [Candidatus Eremiobacteraeota bacterium]MDQ6943370.1 hypothetical protein [Candidatus Eremiobacteraeota bacterium]